MKTWVSKGDFSLPREGSRSVKKLRICMPFIALILFLLLFGLFLTYRIYPQAPLWRLDLGWRWLLHAYGQRGLTGPVRSFVIQGAVFLAFLVLFSNIIVQKLAVTATPIDIVQGSSHWATRKELLSARLIQSGSGVYIGGWKDPANDTVHYLRHDGPEHVLAVAPTGSGKGVCLVIPTLLSWEESVFVLDMKGENWILTSGWRQQNVGPVYRFAPAEGPDFSCCYNPLREIGVGTPHEQRDIQIVASLLIDPDGKGLEDHWQKSAFTVLQGTILHEVCSARLERREPTIFNVREHLIGGTPELLARVMKQGPHLQDGSCHPLVVSVMDELANKDIREASSIVSTALSALNLWLDPLVAGVTGKSDFRLRDLVSGSRPSSLYLIVPPSDLIRLRPLLRVMVSQLIYALSTSLELDDEMGGVKSRNKFKMLMMLDEFPALKKLDLVESALAWIRGYGVKLYMICQSYKQLNDIYGKDETISGNSHINVCFAPNDDDTAAAISKKCGKTTVMVGGATTSGKKVSPSPFARNQTSISVNTMARDLLTPDECRRLPIAQKDSRGFMTEPGAMLIFVAGTAPIYGVQTPWFFDKTFKERAAMTPPQSSPILYATSMPPDSGQPNSEGVEEKIMDEPQDDPSLQMD